MSTLLRVGLPPLPVHMRARPVDARGYPVPWFVAWIDGVPDFRVTDSDKLRRAGRERRCWLCGEPLGRFLTFVIGPMCAVNRVFSEPPCHTDCAVFAAQACPFLTLPRAQRRESNLPSIAEPPAGVMIKRNPGVTLLWTTLSYRIQFDPLGGPLFLIGDPEEVTWYAQGRSATCAEVLESIDTGLPALEAICDTDDDRRALKRYHRAALALLPVASCLRDEPAPREAV